MTSDKRLRVQKLKSWCRECCSALACANQQKNKERAYAAQAKWRDENRTQWNGWMAAANHKRYCAKMRRVPCWYDQAKAREIYELAAEFREAGFKVDVDHIVPLQGELVSGLHWHGNLRVCLAGHNRGKRNRMSPHHGLLAAPVGQTI